MPRFVSAAMSLPGQVLVHLQGLRQYSQVYQEAVKRLRKEYTVKSVAKTQEKYLKNPAKLRLELEAQIKAFAKDFQQFQQVYAELYKQILGTFNAAETEEYSDQVGLKKILVTARDRAAANPEEFYFPPSSVKKFEKEFRSALKELAVQLRTESAGMQRLAQGKRFVVRFFDRFIARRSAERRASRSAGRIQAKYEASQQVYAHLQLELKEGIQQDFLALLLEYLGELHTIVRNEGSVKEDLIIIINDVEKETADLLAKIIPFMSLHEKNQQMKAQIELLQKTFIETHQKVQAQLNDEARWGAYILAIQESINVADIVLLGIMQGLSKEEAQRRVDVLLGQRTG